MISFGVDTTETAKVMQETSRALGLGNFDAKPIAASIEHALNLTRIDAPYQAALALGAAEMESANAVSEAIKFMVPQIQDGVGALEFGRDLLPFSSCGESISFAAHALAETERMAASTAVRAAAEVNRALGQLTIELWNPTIGPEIEAACAQFRRIEEGASRSTAASLAEICSPADVLGESAAMSRMLEELARPQFIVPSLLPSSISEMVAGISMMPSTSEILRSMGECTPTRAPQSEPLTEENRRVLDERLGEAVVLVECPKCSTVRVADRRSAASWIQGRPFLVVRPPPCECSEPGLVWQLRSEVEPVRRRGLLDRRANLQGIKGGGLGNGVPRGVLRLVLPTPLPSDWERDDAET